MKDRVPTYPGRVKLIPVEGKENTYDMTRADVPIEDGTPLSKATLLADTTAAMAGLDEGATPNDMFKALAGRIVFSEADLEAGTASAYPDGTLYFVYKP